MTVPQSSEFGFTMGPWAVDVGRRKKEILVVSREATLARLAPVPQMRANAWVMAAAWHLYESVLPFTFCDPTLPPPPYHDNPRVRDGWELMVTNARRAIKLAEVR